MKCLICKNGLTKKSEVTVTLEREHMTLVFKEVPADVCQNCGEEYIAEKIVGNLSRMAEKAAKSGVEVFVQKYGHAS